MTNQLNGERLTIDAVAEKLEVHPTTVWRWVTNGVKGRKLRSFLIGGSRYVAEEDLNAFCSDSQNSHKPRHAKASDAARILDGHGIKKR